MRRFVVMLAPLPPRSTWWRARPQPRARSAPGRPIRIIRPAVGHSFGGFTALAAAGPFLDHQSGRPEYRVDVLASGRNSFTNVCDIDAYVAAGVGEPVIGLVEAQAEHRCAADLLPIEAAHRVTDLYVVSFLTKELQGNAQYGRYLTPGYADRHDLPVELRVKPESRERGADAAAA